MSFDDSFRKDRRNRTLQITPSRLVATFTRTSGGWTGGPLKPYFGSSGAVRRLDRVFPPLVRVFGPSIPTPHLRVPPRPYPHAQTSSTPHPPPAPLPTPPP